MDKISLSIPCLVLSSETNITGKTEKHVLTPFGYLDIMFPSAMPQDQESTPLEIKVVGDIDSWMVDDSMPAEFKVVLRKFIVDMVQLCTRSSFPRAIKNSLQLQGENQDIKVILKR